MILYIKEEFTRFLLPDWLVVAAVVAAEWGQSRRIRSSQLWRTHLQSMPILQSALLNPIRHKRCQLHPNDTIF